MTEITEHSNPSSKYRDTKFTDMDNLTRRTRSNPKLMMEMISIYLEQTPPLLHAMKESMQNEDWSLLQAAVHKIIPSFSIMGINTEFENMAKKVQEYARTQQKVDEIPDLVLQIDKVCKQAVIELADELNTIKNTAK